MPPAAITSAWIDRLAEEAAAHSPALLAARTRADAADAAAAAIRTWEDPTVSFGVRAPGRGGFSSSSEGNLAYGLDQSLPLYGRPALERKEAVADAVREGLASDYATQRLRRDLRLALDQLALAGREAEIAATEVAWLDATLDAVDQRYRVGLATQVEWLKVQTARALAEDEAVTRRAEREHSTVALNRLLNRDLHAPWPELAEPAVQPALFYTGALVRAALQAEPQLKLARQETVSAQAAADLTHRDRLPRVAVGLQAWQYAGDGELRQETVTVSLSVPWINHAAYDQDWQRDRARKRAADFEAADRALAVREELHHHIVDLDVARRRAVLLRDQLIPLTRQTLASAQAAWEHDLGPLQDILDAHRLLLADQLALARAVAAQADRLAELAYLTGSADAARLITLAGTPPAAADSHPPDPLP